jgi:indolepyruvate ferredoxin oxidoreductase
MTRHEPIRDGARYRLEDRYDRASGRVFMTGTQALVRVLLDQARRDRAAGLETAGFVSGYRGSPLGGVDLELWRAKKLIADNRIEFLPAVNEDLAATAVLGSQQVETNPERTVQGVFSMWYGKGPGVDRAGDALKHGNAYGSSPHGGVLVVAGDDHGCVSSSMPHQSDVAFMAWFMPTLNPASVAEYLEFGEYGYALSRFSGMWVGFKAVSETVESAASVELRPDRVFARPISRRRPAGSIIAGRTCPDRRSRSGWRTRSTPSSPSPTPTRSTATSTTSDAPFGIVTTGKGHLDLMEALRLLGIGEKRMPRTRHRHLQGRHGLAAGAPRRASFVRGKREVLVIEEKRGIIESQFKEYFYDWPGDKPERMVGKRDENGERLVPWTGELSPRQLVPIVARRLDGIFPGQGFCERAERILAAIPSPSRSRAPPARPISAPAARTTPRPACRRDRRRWPASAAISWRAGWTARPPR